MRRIIAASIVALVSGCGGGSGGSAPPTTVSPPPVIQQPTPGDLENARASGVQFMLKAATNELEIRWIDRFPAEEGYRIERSTQSGEWQLQESLPASVGSGQAYEWRRVIDQRARYRVTAQRGAYVVPLENAGGSAVEIEPDIDEMSLLVNQQEPLRGAVEVSVSGASQARAVEYYVDLDRIAVSEAGPSFPVEWNSKNVTDGGHLLLAHVILPSELRIELRLAVGVDNPNLTVRLIVPTTSSGLVPLRLTATSDAGVRSVEFFLNGASLALQNAPAAPPFWQYVLDVRGMAPGPATIRALVTDNNGEQVEATQGTTIDNLPELTLEEPIDGAIVSGELTVRGAVADDLPGVFVRAHLSDVQIFEVSQSPFTRTYSLANLPAGAYTFTIGAFDSSNRATHIQRRIIIAASQEFEHELVETHPDLQSPAVELLAASGGRLTYRVSGEPARVLRGDGTRVELERSSAISTVGATGEAQFRSRWSQSGEYVAVAGTEPEGGAAKVFVFDAEGRREEIPYAYGGDEFSSLLRAELHGTWLVFGERTIHMRNLANGALAGPVSGRMIRGHAFASTGGAERLFFGRDMLIAPGSSRTDLLSYTLATGAVEQVSSGDGHSRQPQTDGVRLAWETKSLDGSFLSPPYGLSVAPLDNPSAVVVKSTTMINFDLADGVLAWRESASNASVVKVDDGTETTITTSTSATLYGASQGSVVFGEGGKLHVWSRARSRRVFLDILPTQVLVGGGYVYFTVGMSGGTLYRTAL